MKKRIIFAAIAFALTLSSCKKDVVTPSSTGGKSDVNAALQLMAESEIQQTQFNASTSLNWLSAKGTRVLLSGNSLTHQDGSMYSGNVVMNFIDIYEPGDMILNQKPTVAENGVTLITSGEFMVEFIADNGETLVPSPYALSILTSGEFSVTQNMQAFQGGELGDEFVWVEDDSSIVDSVFDTVTNNTINIMNISSLDVGFGWINCDAYSLSVGPFFDVRTDMDSSFYSNSVVYYHDDVLNAVISVPYEEIINGRATYSVGQWYQGIPNNTELDVIVISFMDGEYYLDIVEDQLITSDVVIAASPQISSLADIERALGDL